MSAEAMGDESDEMMADSEPQPNLLSTLPAPCIPTASMVQPISPYSPLQISYTRDVNMDDKVMAQVSSSEVKMIEGPVSIEPEREVDMADIKANKSGIAVQPESEVEMTDAVLTKPSAVVPQTINNASPTTRKSSHMHTIPSP